MSFSQTLTLRDQVSQSITNIVQQIAAERGSELPEDFHARVDYPPEYEMGQYASPVAMELSRVFRKNPKEIAGEIAEKLSEKAEEREGLFKEIKIEGPGFLNFKVNAAALSPWFAAQFSASEWLTSLFPVKSSPKILFEFVSANPTGPLNIVSARAAAVGDSICRVIERAGIPVTREYYVNDFGNQVRLLGISFAWRYLEKNGIEAPFPEEGYRGEYIKEVLEEIIKEGKLPDTIATLPEKEKAEEWLEEAGKFFGPRGVEFLLSTQKKDLGDFRAGFDNFFQESTLHAEGKVDQVFALLKERGHAYEQDGAWFFASKQFGDDKDRVIVRSDGRPTYLLADIAYHKSKIDRGFSGVYDIWGPDHHGYIARLSGAMQAMGFGEKPEEEFQVLIVQQVNLLENGKPLVMSKRLGQFQTMRDLIDKIPVDVSRYFFVARGQNTHLDFDLEAALDQSSQNPVYYIQYAHARIHSIFREVEIDYNAKLSIEPEKLLGYVSGAHRDELLFFLLRFPEEINEIARNREVQRLATWLYEAAALFTKFYHEKENRIKALMEADKSEAEFLLILSRLAAETMREGLSLLGISAPEKM